MAAILNSGSINERPAPVKRLKAAGIFTLLNTRTGSSFFQRVKTPKPTNIASGAVKGINTLLKYGGPTEIFPKPNASSNKGYKVPNNILAQATTSNTLFNNNAVSRENN